MLSKKPIHYCNSIFGLILLEARQKEAFIQNLSRKCEKTHIFVLFWSTSNNIEVVKTLYRPALKHA